MPQGVGLTPHLFVTEASAGRITQLLSPPLAPPLSKSAYGRVKKIEKTAPGTVNLKGSDARALLARKSDDRRPSRAKGRRSFVAPFSPLFFSFLPELTLSGLITVMAPKIMALIFLKDPLPRRRD